MSAGSYCLLCVAVAVLAASPGAFTMPWNAVTRYRRVEPGRSENNVPPSPVSSSTVAGPLLEASCAENPFSYFGDQSVPIPQAAKPDF